MNFNDGDIDVSRDRVIQRVMQRIESAPHFHAMEAAREDVTTFDVLVWHRPALAAAVVVIALSVASLARARTSPPPTVLGALGVPPALAAYMESGQVPDASSVLKEGR